MIRKKLRNSATATAATSLLVAISAIIYSDNLSMDYSRLGCDSVILPKKNLLDSMDSTAGARF